MTVNPDASDRLDALVIVHSILPPGIMRKVFVCLSDTLDRSSLRACLTVSKEFHDYAQTRLSGERLFGQLQPNTALQGDHFLHVGSEARLEGQSRYLRLPCDRNTAPPRSSTLDKAIRSNMHVRVAYLRPHENCGTTPVRDSIPGSTPDMVPWNARKDALSRWAGITRPLRHELPNIRTVILSRAGRIFGQRVAPSQACFCYAIDRSFRLVYEKICSGLLCRYHVASEALTARVHTVVLPVSVQNHSCCFDTPMDIPLEFKPRRCVFMFEPGDLKNTHWPTYFSRTGNPLRTRMPQQEPRPCTNMFYRVAIACFQVGEQCEIIIVAADHGALRLPALSAHDSEIRCARVNSFTDPVALACYGFSGDLVNSRNSDAIFSEDDRAAAVEMIDRKVAALKALFLAWVDDVIDPCDKPDLSDDERIKESKSSRKNRYSSNGTPVRVMKRQDDREDEENKAAAQELVRGWAGGQPLTSLKKAELRHSMRDRIKFMTLHEYHMLEGDSDVFPNGGAMI